jgi:hypothetical protein
VTGLGKVKAKRNTLVGVLQNYIDWSFANI